MQCCFKYQAKLSPESPIFMTIMMVINSIMNFFGHSRISQFNGLAR